MDRAIWHTWRMQLSCQHTTGRHWLSGHRHPHGPACSSMACPSVFVFSHGAQVRVRAGSQLFARFPCGMDALGVLGAVRKLAAEALGSESAVRVEVATGSVHIYITFLDEDLNISKFTLELRRKGARITFVEDPKGCFGYMTPVAAGMPAVCAATCSPWQPNDSPCWLRFTCVNAFLGSGEEPKKC